MIFLTPSIPNAVLSPLEYRYYTLAEAHQRLVFAFGALQTEMRRRDEEFRAELTRLTVVNATAEKNLQQATMGLVQAIHREIQLKQIFDCCFNEYKNTTETEHNVILSALNSQKAALFQDMQAKEGQVGSLNGFLSEARLTLSSIEFQNVSLKSKVEETQKIIQEAKVMSQNDNILKLLKQKDLWIQRLTNDCESLKKDSGMQSSWIPSKAAVNIKQELFKEILKDIEVKLRSMKTKVKAAEAKYTELKKRHKQTEKQLRKYRRELAQSQYKLSRYEDLAKKQHDELENITDGNLVEEVQSEDANPSEDRMAEVEKLISSNISLRQLLMETLGKLKRYMPAEADRLRKQVFGDIGDESDDITVMGLEDLLNNSHRTV